MIGRYEKQIKNNPLMVAVKFARYKFIAKMLQEGDVVLEVGCHDGVSSNFFSQFCRKVDALDLDVKALNEAKDNFDHINFLHCDAFTYETNVKYDVVVMLDFIEHFTFEDGKKLIKKYAKMLSSKGVLIIGTPSKNFIKYRAEHNSAHHLYEYYPDELKSMLSYYFDRSMTFAMNDEIVHTGNIDLAWFIFEVCSYPKGN